MNPEIDQPAIFFKNPSTTWDHVKTFQLANHLEDSISLTVDDNEESFLKHHDSAAEADTTTTTTSNPIIIRHSYSDLSKFEEYMDILYKTHRKSPDKLPKHTWKNGFLFRCISCRSSRLKTYLVNEQDFIQTLSKLPCRPFDEELHGQLISTIYTTLTREPCDLSPGDHWTQIGFQGPNPSTDFRDTGLLSLLCLFYWTNCLEPSELSLQCYRLSRDDDFEHSFPFCLVGINLTGLLLRLMKQGQLDRAFNSRHEVTQTFMLLFCALFYKLGQIWQTEQCTISEMQGILDRLGAKCRKNPSKFLNSFLDVCTDFE